jgi:hypothetical protein
MRCFPSIDPSSIATSFIAVLEIENILANIGEKTGELPGRGPLFSS